MTGLSEHRSISAALLRIVTGAVIVLVLLACDNGQPDTLADNGEVMLTLRISLPTATDGSTATRAITSNEENAIDIAQLKVLVFKASGSTETFSYEAPQVQLLGGKYMVTLKQSLAGEKYRLAVIANAEFGMQPELQATAASPCGEKLRRHKLSRLPHLWETSRYCARWHA